MKRRACIASLAVALFLAAPALGAQAGTADLRVKLRAATGEPVGGALIALLDAKDSVVAEGLSDEKGTRVLRAPAGTYRVRVRRIGYLPFVAPTAVDITRGGELELRVESPRVVLESIVVNSKSQCRRTDEHSESLSLVWDEIDKALRASRLTTSDLSGMGYAMIYRRQSGIDGTVVSSDTTIFPINATRPFGAVDPRLLVQNGYVVGDPANGWRYFGPDETVLLSDQFGATHCFRLVRDATRRAEIGVAFEPVPNRKLADIAGVLWVDESSAELREIVFHYVNAGAISDFEGGGFTRFRRVPSGAWLVADWLLRVPRLEQGPPNTFPRFKAVGYNDNGGGILNRPAAQDTAGPKR